MYYVNSNLGLHKHLNRKHNYLLKIQSIIVHPPTLGKGYGTPKNCS